MTPRIARWVCLICMALDFAMVPIDLWLRRPGQSILDFALGLLCAGVAGACGAEMEVR